MLHQAVTHNQSHQPLTACQIHQFPLEIQEKKQETVPTSVNLRDRTLPYADRNAIKDKLSFLKPYQNSIHSHILVGSTAYNAHTKNSDIDIVIITTNGGYEKVCNFLFEKEIDESLSSDEKSKFEYTILPSQQTEKLFQISSFCLLHSPRGGYSG